MTTPASSKDSPFHAGELAVQTAAGVREDAAQLGPMFRRAMAEAHRAFFERLPFLIVGSLDSAGQPWASMLIGDPGFIHAPDPETLMILAQPPAGDPLAEAIHEGAAIGILGIELQARRRARVNGRVREVGAKGFSLHVDQAFGNCPKYITPRKPSSANSTLAAVSASKVSAQLSDVALACIAQADTCFIASASAADSVDGDRREGVDASHRGGNRGFVQASRTPTGTQLFMPDYPGNNAFNTLGNLARYPRAGLCFPNFETGDLLLVTCDTEIVFAGADPAAPNTNAELLARFEGAERLVIFRVRNGVYFQHFMPFHWDR